MATRPVPFTTIAPEGASTPLTYSPAVVLHPNGCCVLVSGQVGIDADGRVGATFRDQAAIACRNLLNVLAAAGMNAANIAKTTVFLTSVEHVAAWRASRSEVLGDIRPASTLVIVSALVDPRLQVEIEAIAVDVTADKG